MGGGGAFSSYGHLILNKGGGTFVSLQKPFLHAGDIFLRMGFLGDCPPPPLAQITTPACYFDHVRTSARPHELNDTTVDCMGDNDRSIPVRYRSDNLDNPSISHDKHRVVLRVALEHVD